MGACCTKIYYSPCPRCNRLVQLNSLKLCTHCGVPLKCIIVNKDGKAVCW